MTTPGAPRGAPILPLRGRQGAKPVEIDSLDLNLRLLKFTNIYVFIEVFILLVFWPVAIASCLIVRLITRFLCCKGLCHEK